MSDIQQVTMIDGNQVELEADKFGLKIYTMEVNGDQDHEVIYIVKDNKILFQIDATAACSQNMACVYLDVKSE